MFQVVAKALFALAKDKKFDKMHNLLFNGKRLEILTEIDFLWKMVSTPDPVTNRFVCVWTGVFMFTKRSRNVCGMFTESLNWQVVFCINLGTFF
jgi:hypothetical protein